MSKSLSVSNPYTLTLTDTHTLMRIIRLTQLCLKRSDFPPSRLPKLLDSTPTNPASLQIFPQSRFPQKLDKTVLGLRSGVLGWFLPEGFPYSVHANYLKFTTWTSLQGITSSFISGSNLKEEKDSL